MSMAGNGGANNNNSRSGGASISVAASAVSSPETRFPRQERRRRWGGCLGGLSCFRSQKGGRRIVPASRIPDGNASGNRANGPQPAGLVNQATAVNPSLLAPPSSPASFTNSSLPSTAQSPSCFLSMSANSPGGPSSTMFATGPYAHETQLVSPPVFSTFTTEPSTAPFTPPPEMNHLTTPSSPDVPYAQFLSSSMDLKSAGKSGYASGNDLQATYPLYPGSPASSLISPNSGTSGDGLSSSFPEREFPARWGASLASQDSQFSQSPSSRVFGLDAAMSKNFMLSQDSSFFYPATSAQFYLDQAQQATPSYSHSGGRLSLSREADVHSNGNGHQNRHGKNGKPDVEEIEAYRASFGFSADEIVITPHYVEISDDVLDDSFSIAPFASNTIEMEEIVLPGKMNGFGNGVSSKTDPGHQASPKLRSENSDHVTNGVVGGGPPELFNNHEDQKPLIPSRAASDLSEHGDSAMTDDDDIFSRIGNSKVGKKYRIGLSSSDAEIDYRRGRSLREGRGDFSWRD
ncbi:hypothetical protein Syun_014843 [Stephania yunnanensis]|uniref:Hydroxyproline-rich glycoprotein family protein n=1 Tax=Stephania yunnanensis TaxID=152371 RepID=A0AAP0JLU0_9MAGN